VTSTLPASSVDYEPEVSLDHWLVVDVHGFSRSAPKGVTQHLVGCLSGIGFWRITTPITESDFDEKWARTSSGRLYHLLLSANPVDDAESIKQVIFVWKNNLRNYNRLIVKTKPIWQLS
jgi:hypothetical protein